MITSQTSPQTSPPQTSAAAAVTFTLAHPCLEGLDVAVVGDFNDWDAGATPMHRLDGAYTATLTLPTGRRYRFRYLAGDGQWFNDDAADDYEPNVHGGQDSILDLTPDPGVGPTGDPLEPRQQAGPDPHTARHLTSELDRALEQDEHTARELRIREQVGP